MIRYKTDLIRYSKALVRRYPDIDHNDLIQDTYISIITSGIVPEQCKKQYALKICLRTFKNTMAYRKQMRESEILYDNFRNHMRL